MADGIGVIEHGTKRNALEEVRFREPRQITKRREHVQCFDNRVSRLSGSAMPG